jgi:hypothetical protein
MKRNHLIFLLILATCAFRAQEDTHAALRKLITAKAPGIVLSQKLIVFNVWSESDIASREANKEVDKAASVFKYAKLTGGKDGMVAVGIQKTNITASMIIFHADGIKELINLTENDLDKVSLPGKNGIYNSSGVLIGKDYDTSEIYEAIHKLITR